MRKNLHKQERDQFRKLFEQGYIDRFEDRFKILEIFLQTERHITFDELVELLESSGFYIKSDFIRETLDLMCRFGFAHKIRFENEPEKYEHRHLGQHHDHMICTKCRKIIEFQDDQLEAMQLKITQQHHFHILQHKMEIYGICSECLENRVQLIPLNMAKQGEKLIIKEIIGGANSRMRLMTMGLKVNDEIEVITSQGNRQLVVAIDNNRYVLGKGLATKILVKNI